jgi:hypothetical protein
MAEIIVTVDKEGNAEIAVNGVSGKSCKEITANLEKALGTVISDKPTSEMFEQEVNRHVDAGS